MNTRTDLFAVLLALFLCAFSTIIIRHDLADSAYLEHAKPYSDVIVHMNLEDEGAPPDGEGTLIRRRWALTAAHVAVEADIGHVITVGGHNVPVQGVHLHPDWDGGATDDIALIDLRDPIRDVTPVPLYYGTDEAGRTVTVVGRGDTGTGLTGPVANDGQLRAAQNRVDGADAGLIWWMFDAPGDSNAVYLEGISGPGDSGGPAFIDVDGRAMLAGVGSSQSTRATGGREGLYGVTEYYVRVSHYLDWVGETIALHEPMR